jgi:GrpB-like predicted nucleotidyltransferase (UPF0157 family)
VIIISDYSEKWHEIFINEKNKILGEANPSILNFYHIGSTSIAKMPAKPIIDMIIEVDDFQNIHSIEAQFVKLGYSLFRRNLIPGLSAISQKRASNIGFNAHFFVKNDPQIERHLNFKTFLTENIHLAQEYAKLKFQLVNDGKNDIEKYNTGKDALIHEIDCAAKQELKNENVAKDISLSSEVTLSKEEISLAAILNHYLFLSHYPQYIHQCSLYRAPGITIIDSDLNSAEFNHVIDIDYSPSDLSHELKTHFLQLKIKKRPFQWWDSFCSHKKELKSVLAEQGGKAVLHSILYKKLDTNRVNNEFVIVQLLSEADIKEYVFSFEEKNRDEKEFLGQIAYLPHSSEDPIQFFRLRHNEETLGYFTAVFYAQIVGIYWFNSLIETKSFSHLINAISKTQFKNYKIMTIISTNPEFFSTLGFGECGLMTSYII